MRPNIRVEIQNNLAEEAMDVDENEEGELHDDEELKEPELNQSPKITFKSEEEKLQERAKRFSLAPDEIKNFTEADLSLLHGSLGIGSTNETDIRCEVIHLRGIDQMSAGDILDYFLDYAPISVEWIDEECCNVTFVDKETSARALNFNSTAVRGMPVRDDSSYFDAIETDETYKVNKDRQVHLQDDEEIAFNELLTAANSVDISEITTTIPPGYWRLGKKHPKTKCLLLRFSLKRDKQAVKVEHLSRYYKAPNKKSQVGIFGRNKDLHKTSEGPWTTLAKNWDEDAEFREKSPTHAVEAEPKLKNESLRVRLGSKRNLEQPAEEPPKKSVKIPRMRMYADEEEEKIKRKKMLKRISQQMNKIEKNTSTNNDLRSVLNLTSRTNAVKKERNEVVDLGATLKNRNKKMVFEIKTEGRRRRQMQVRDVSDDEDTGFRSDRYDGGKTRSKVAVVIKTQKKPAVASAVASTVWSRVGKTNDVNTTTDESSDQSQSDDDADPLDKIPPNRPGFVSHNESPLSRSNFKSPLKIEINNDHFRTK